MRVSTAMLVSRGPLGIDADRWARTVKSYKIDGRVVIDLSTERGRERFAELTADTRLLENQSNAFLETCASILRRTDGMETITDDNMGDEWLYLKHHRWF